MSVRVEKVDGPSLRREFLAQVGSRPEAPALVVRGATRSYSELERSARIWAKAIVENCPAPERVGVFGYRSEVSYVATLAALMAGCTFVPLNPTFPPEKTADMVAASDLDAIIVDKTALPQLRSVLGDHKLLVVAPDQERVDDLGPAIKVLAGPALAGFSPLDQLPPITPDSTAYLLFTSGSTGKPKGVPVTHANVLHFVSSMSRRYNIVPEDRLTQTFDQTFDLSVFDLFMAWTNGASVYSMATIDLLAPQRFVNKNGITVWFSVPSVPAQMLTRSTLTPNCMPGLRLSLFCGEPLPRRSAQAWQAAAPNSIVENLYGPTELTIACFVYKWDPASSPALCHHDLVPIGVPIEGLSGVIVDEQLRPVADGESGELCVCGPQTTPGYWLAPDKTAERFVDLPFNRVESRRFYRTGDRVMRLSTGDYAFIGRTDNQVKILGHRVELGEIEAVLLRGAGVAQAIAIPWPIVEGSAQGVVAYVCGSDIDSQALIREAKSAMPAYMVPQAVTVIPKMPLNANGKVDRRALRDQLAQTRSATEGA
jgi:amino acid adenylation domain-containing protein